MRHAARSNLRHPSFKTTKEKLPAAPREQMKKREMLAIFLTILSVFGTLLTLLGYGVAISVDELHIGYETLFTSPFELIELSPWALLHIFEKLSAAGFAEIYWNFLHMMLPYIAVLALLLGVFGVAWKRKEYSSRMKVRPAGATRWRLHPPTSQDSLTSLLGKMLIFVSAMWLAVPALIVAGIFAVTVLIALFIMVPAIGMTAGRAHIKNDVLVPAHCAPLKNAAARLVAPNANAKKLETFATCIRVRDGRSIDESGRLVFSTSSAVILFNPSTGRFARIPTRDLLVETIGGLQAGATAN